MARVLWFLALLALLLTARAQDDAQTETAGAATVEQEAADAAEADGEELDTDIDPALFEDTELDEQTYEEDDDVFVPTEEIPADEPIPFPTDI